MPVRYELDIESKIVRTIFTGIVTENEVAEHAAHLGKDPAFQPGFSELADLSKALEVRLGYPEFQHLEFIDPFSREAKRAFVTTPRSQAYGLTRMFQMMRHSPENIQIFDTVESALAWLKPQKSQKLHVS
jgi:hypothetical protein